jgi:drug/metabolite transporter (DMT)-like permease
MKFDHMTILAICIGVVGTFFIVGGYQTSGTEWIALGAGMLGIAYVVWRQR